MIRLTLLFVFSSFLAIYAIKDWYKSLCGLILMMAVMEHPDMPKGLMGIQGLNPFNILLGIIVSCWIFGRHREHLVWDMPRRVNIFLVLYLTIVLIGFLRMLFDQQGLFEYEILCGGTNLPTFGSLFSENLINTIKWVIPGLLLFDGCRSRNRFLLGLFALLGIYFLLALQVIKWMPIGEIASGGALSDRSLKILVNEIGYHRVNLSMMLAGASWAVFAIRPLGIRGSHTGFIFLVSFAILFAQALTGGRAGYVTWGGTGLALCLMKWRKYLLAMPFAVIAIITLVPGVMDRMLQGFSPESRDVNVRIHGTMDYAGQMQGDGQADMYTITAGRSVAWPYVIDKIEEAPLFGYGREAMQRVGIASFLLRAFGESFPHPHNAYLQLLLDNGIVGFIIIIPFYLLVIRCSFVLFRDSRSPICMAIGGATLSLVLALMIASMGSQSFYPREGAVGMWCAIGLMFRVYVQRSRVLSYSSGEQTSAFDKYLWN